MASTYGIGADITIQIGLRQSGSFSSPNDSVNFNTTAIPSLRAPSPANIEGVKFESSSDAITIPEIRPSEQDIQQEVPSPPTTWQNPPSYIWKYK
jgi:hypothetical protein